MTTVRKVNAVFRRGETATLGPWLLDGTGIDATDVTAGAIATIRISRVTSSSTITYVELSSASTSQIAISATSVTVELLSATTGELPVAATYQCEIAVTVGDEIRVIGTGDLTALERLPESAIPTLNADDSYIRDFDAILLRDTDPTARPAMTGTNALLTWHDGELKLTTADGVIDISAPLSDATPENVSFSAGSAGVSDEYARADHTHLAPFTGAGLTATDVQTAIIEVATSIKSRTQSATTDTLVLLDAGKAIDCTNSGATTETVPLNSTVAFPVGTVIDVVQLGSGQVTLAPTVGVTLSTAGATLKTRTQYSVVSLRKTATNTWLVWGDLAAS